MLMTFDEALDRVEEGETPSVLLGNGFSRAWRDDIFNYANLLDAADFGARSTEIRELFNRLGTYDFEAVMRALEFARMVLESYGSHHELISDIERDQELLKETLISAISRTHPDLPQDVTQAQFTAARRFLSLFGQIFTVNYDLLFYWARNQSDLPPEHYSTDDGFRAGRRWKGYGTGQEVHFLHGGLHLFEQGCEIRKHTFSDGRISIIAQVRDNLESDRFPLFVSEPTSEKKRGRIEHNPYLHYCYRALGDLRGSFFILGHSLDENDQHIFEKIKKSDVNQVFVSLHGDENNAANTRTKANAIAFLGTANRSVEFFDAQTASIWI